MRIKTGTVRKAKHNKLLERTKGYRMSKSKLYKSAKDADLHAGQYAFVGRKKRKRDFRRLWIQRINAALMPFNMKYSHFIAGLTSSKISLNRKILADMAVNDAEAFAKIVQKIKK